MARRHDRATAPATAARSLARRRTLPVLVVGALTAVLGVLVAPAASAHDQLVSTDPADGSTVDVVPDHVTLTFEDPAVAIGTVIEVTGPDGSVVSSGAPQLVDSDVTQAITAQDLPAGKYAVTWRVTSPDGHVVSGDFAFAAKSGSGDEAPAPATTSSAAPSDEASESAPSDDASSDDTAGMPISNPTTSPSAAASSGSGGGAVAWVIIGIGLLIGVALGLLGWWRGRRRAADGSTSGFDTDGSGETGVDDGRA
ncbi:copper resistance protein CopC [Cellulomonas sp. JH27-2]|uniref:copper resistance CopC family protein n=1 Tax=Cellulomonas sp. JH27-2 TaxID=2774139 RepID=UPI00177CA32B|nr:copper resistance protein CopC [Cellulomonas sp. JH27-2]MBD8058096.1 copper resistance protein CopC [Cellulomonas sp. JH27-2]